MSPDNSIGYEYAGKGTRARLRLEQVTAKNMNVARSKAKAKPDYQQNLKPRETLPATERIAITERGLKKRITRYTLALANVSEISQRLDREGFGPRSKILIAHVRNQALEVIRTMIEEGIIDQEDLDAYRKKCAKEQRERFNRGD